MPGVVVLMILVALSLGGAVIISGCGSGGFFGQPQGQTVYTITIYATSADLVRTSTVTLTIE
jgi:hypothetical protein